MTTVFTCRTREIISLIPHGRVTTYSIIAVGAGSRSGARQVARILHSCSRKYTLPWHRVVNKNGRISLPPGKGFELQKQLLEDEGVLFDQTGTIDLQQFLWLPGRLP